MGVAVLHPHDSLINHFSTNTSPPLRHKKPITNRRRRSPSRHQSQISHPPPSPHNHTNHVRILKRGEDINVKIPIEKPDLKSNRQIGSDPMKISTPIRISNRKSMPALFYAGPVTSTSPPPSEVPLPAFFANKTVAGFEPTDATNDLIKILRLDIA
ncbi:hypothetical protein AtNW77_Chr2g0244351 [Arabidopsis thaliana]|uniref:Uncharacterized protein n=2 Tax=Arabidopsis TaxID=3701 RepID=A0A178VQU6_ARATH|nr:hypothetical protein ISN45_At02g019210 [Arabidopsis thaliana x Arabidopsis arenosa]OAP08186.1 hypothetical protein AXX17_AT2G21000 [Arabidopsis thaliana]CAA0371381.1 unnamed protein product [Arabidopsis thaliana]